MYDLKGLRKALSLIKTDLAQLFDCKQSNISGMEKTLRDLEPYQDKILREKYDNSIIDMYIISDDEPKKSDDNISDTKGKLYTTYLLPMSAMGGSLGGFTESTMLHNCEAIVSPIENVDFAITVYGESMSPEYPSGSRVLIKKINPDIFIDYGRVYVLDTPNGVIIKEVQRSETPGYVTCYSKNSDPKFTPFDINMNDIYGWYNVLMCLSMK